MSDLEFCGVNPDIWISPPGIGKGTVTFARLGRFGRFANGLFQIASTIGIARKLGFAFAFPQWINWEHHANFGAKEDCEIYKHLVHELPTWSGEPFRKTYVKWGFHELKLATGNHDLEGSLQSERYFQHAIAEVRHHLTFRDEPKPLPYVALHFRAGDYEEKPDAFHPRCTREYYEAAMRAMGRREYLVFTDDVNAARRVLEGLEVIFPPVQPDYLTAFKMMKRCHSFICANSSYSLMAAILADQTGKEIVCPARWFGTSAGISGEDCYPAGALVL